MSVGPLWPQLERRLELPGSLLRITFIFEGEGKVVMGEGIVGLKLQCLSIVLNGLIPGFLAGECRCLPAVTFRGLRETRGCNDEQ